MTVALWLLLVQGVIGAFDTLYYHEWRARLPARGVESSSELKLHAARDLFYAVLFGTLPWVEWHGRLALVIAAVLIAEIILTLADFVVEITARKSLGDVYAGERVTHAVMGILYGVMVANLLPVLGEWWRLPSQVVGAVADVPATLRWTLAMMAAGVLASGARDLYAAYELPYGGWPWR